MVSEGRTAGFRSPLIENTSRFHKALTSASVGPLCGWPSSKGPLMTTSPVPHLDIRPVLGMDLKSLRADPVRQAHTILRVGFTAAPIIAGADKFTHLLVDWDKYLAPQVAAI